MSLKSLQQTWPDVPIATCKGCGKKIIWATKQDGTRIPLDPSPPVYGLIRFKNEKDEWIYRVDQMGMTFCSHFTTCKDASRF